jgi:hypothetical protein
VGTGFSRYGRAQLDMAFENVPAMRRSPRNRQTRWVAGSVRLSRDSPQNARKVRPGSYSLLQTRLQTEINTRYAGESCCRIKRGEHPEWPEEKVIENELAARMLLAFDNKEPWTCHQIYKLFDELHAKIFGRQEVTGDRIIAVREIYEAARARLSIMDNEMFARYGLTRFLLLYLVREALQTDETGNQLVTHPSIFLSEPNGRKRLSHAIGELAQTIRTTVIPIYQITVDSKVMPSFDALWMQSGKPTAKGKKKK